MAFSTSRALRPLIALLLAWAIGCGDGSGFVEVGEGRDRELPTGAPDGSLLMDGAVDGETPMDAAIDPDDPDADMDASIWDTLELPDGSVILDDGGGVLLPDGEVIDEETAIMRYDPDIDVSTCAISELDLIEESVDIEDEGGFSLVPGFETGFGLAFQARTTGTCNHNIEVAHLPSTGVPPDPHAVLPDCKTLRDVTLLGLADGWQLAWVDNFTGAAELHTLQLDDAMQPAGAFERNTITNSPSELEMKPVLAKVSGRTLLTWIARGADSFGVRARFLEGSDRDDFTIVDDPNQSPQALAVSRVGTEDRGAVAWVGPLTGPGVWLQQLDETGHATGSPHKLTERVGASSSVDLAPRADGGAVVYSIVIDSHPHVRFRRLDEQGAPRDDERSIIGAPLRAQGASIAAIGGGYVVVYRALQGEGQPEPEIRLAFVSKEGNVIRDPSGSPTTFPIAPATEATGRTYVEVANDGLLMVGWIDSGGTDGSNLMKVARRRLDCGG